MTTMTTAVTEATGIPTGIPTSTAALNPPSLDDVFLSMAFKSSPEEPDEV